MAKGRSWRRCQEQFRVNVGAENTLRCVGQGIGKAEREMLKERHAEGTWPHLLLPDLQSPGGRMCKEVERKAQGEGLLFCPVWVFGEGHCDR